MDVEATIVTEAQQLHAKYTRELHSYKADLQQLKTAFFKRQIDKGRLIPAAEQLAQLSPVADPNNPEHDVALNKLQQIVARALLDPACQGITAADTLHKKVRSHSRLFQHQWFSAIDSVNMLRQLASHCTTVVRSTIRQQLTFHIGW